MDRNGRTALSFIPIGVLRTPFREQPGTPVQPRWAGEAEGRAVVAEPFVAALADLDGFERIWLIYAFDRARSWEPLVVPYRDTVRRGLFATRAPARPNPIGLSAVQLVSVVGCEVRFRGADMLDGTPLLDIKPYVPAFDAWPAARAGWLDAPGALADRADGRFAPPDE